MIGAAENDRAARPSLYRIAVSALAVAAPSLIVLAALAGSGLLRGPRGSDRRRRHAGHRPRSSSVARSPICVVVRDAVDSLGPDRDGEPVVAADRAQARSDGARNLACDRRARPALARAQSACADATAGGRRGGHRRGSGPVDPARRKAADRARQRAGGGIRRRPPEPRDLAVGAAQPGGAGRRGCGLARRSRRGSSTLV